MISVLKNKLNSTFPLWSDDLRIKHNESLSIGSKHDHFDYGKIEITSIDVTPSIGAKKGWVWFKVWTESKVNIGFTYQFYGNPAWTTLSIEKFCEGLQSQLLFANKVRQKVKEIDEKVSK